MDNNSKKVIGIVKVRGFVRIFFNDGSWIEPDKMKEPSVWKGINIEVADGDYPSDKKING